MPRNSSEQLASTLDRVKASSREGVLQSSEMSRRDRELLIKRGYLKDIIKGWYFLTRPGEEAGESTAWYSHFWTFLSAYLENRFGEDYCLSAIASLDVHLGTNLIPNQVTVIAGSAGKTDLILPHGTSVLVYEDKKNLPSDVESRNGLRIMSLPLALAKAPPGFFERRSTDAEIALRSVKETADLIRNLLNGKSRTGAGRLVGAYEFLGEKKRAEEIISAFHAAGLPCESINPFTTASPVLRTTRPVSPYYARIEALYRTMRGPVAQIFEDQQVAAPVNVDHYLAHVDEIYEIDAYNSLSIEGYQVTPELIERIREGSWDPVNNPEDSNEHNALAAKGYLEAFNLVKKSIQDVCAGQDPVSVLSRDYQSWYRALFSECVKAGLLESHHLAGYRNRRVFIKGSRHVPPPASAVADCMDSVFAALEAETSVFVRAVLGHFLFAFVHPYMDGNGRIARFLMNLMLASGGRSWTIVHVKNRSEYMSALESASVDQDIVPFAKFVLEEMQAN